jgi:hypothetical protein
MKKFIVILIVSFLAFFLPNCEKNEKDLIPKEVQEFLDSKEFEKNKNFLISYGEILPENIRVINLLEGEQVIGYYLLVSITQNQVTVAYIQVLPSEKVGALPNGDRYAMNLMSLSCDWDKNTLTGSVMMYDLNFDQFWHATADIINNQVMRVIFNPLPQQTEQKYQEFLSQKKSGGGCGSSGGFFQCYRCAKEQIANDNMFQFVCDMPGISNYCWAGASIFCAHQMLTQ